MAVIPKVLGFAKKVGIGVEGTAAKFWTNVDANVNHWDVDRTVKEMKEIAKDTGQRLKEARTGGNASAKDAATGSKNDVVNKAVDLEAANKSDSMGFEYDGKSYKRTRNKDYDPEGKTGGSNREYLYSSGGNDISGKEFSDMLNKHVADGGEFQDFTQKNLNIAQETAQTGALDNSGIFNTIGGMVKDHPFISAGIAGGAGVLGANLFDDDSSY